MKKLIIGLLIFLFALVAAIAIGSFLAPTDFKVERETTVNRPRSEVFTYVKYLKNQNHWGPWFKKEPTMLQEFRGTDGEVGFVTYWKGKLDDTGEGEQEIKRLVDGERIETELRFKQPFESKSDSYITFESTGENATKIRWGMQGSFPRPQNLMVVFFDLDQALGKDFDQGLTSLKQILETR